MVEFSSAIHKKFRDKEISKRELDEALYFFFASVRKFTIEPFLKSIRQEANNIISQIGIRQKIRTLDAIQLATYHLISDKNSVFVCCDHNLILAAKFFKNQTLTPVDFHE